MLFTEAIDMECGNFTLTVTQVCRPEFSRASGKNPQEEPASLNPQFCRKVLEVR